MDTVILPDTILDKNLKLNFEESTDSEGQVIVHCIYHSSLYYKMIRIWETTYLVDRDSQHKSKLLYADGISLFPTWTHIKSNKSVRFSLIFSKLPKSCVLFDFIEDIPEANGFKANSIKRNDIDVYQVDFYSS